MRFQEYGTKQKNVILLLHGGGLSWWNYKSVAELLSKDFTVCLPILDGHGGSDREFTSIEENAGYSATITPNDGYTMSSITVTMGGVDIMLTKNEADYLDGGFPHLVPGMNHLNGEEALAYSRIRKIDSDFYRTERQRVVLNKLFEKVKGMGVTDLLGLAKAFIPLITTDMTNSEITEYIMELAPLLPELEVITQRVPIDGSWWGANAGTEEQPMYVIYCNLTKNRDMLRETIGGISE